MFTTIGNTKKNEKIYSFGKVNDFEEGYYKIRFKTYTVRLYTNVQLKINDWILFYGIYKDDIIYAEYLEKLIGVDCNLLERMALLIRNDI